MTASPMISSALLHLAIAALVWCCADTGARKPPPLSQLYLELADIPACSATKPAAQPSDAEKTATIAEAVAPGAEVGDGDEDAAVAEEVAAVAQPAAAVVSAEVTAQTAPPVAAEISQAFARASYEQAGMYQSRRYSEVAALAVKKILEGRMTVEERQQLEGEQAQVLATYAGGAGGGYLVSAANETLRRRLDNAAEWERVPEPKNYQLPYQKVTFLVSLNHGEIRVGLLPH